MYSPNIYQVNYTYSRNNNNKKEHINQQICDNFDYKKERYKFIQKTFGLFFLSILSTFGTCLKLKYSSGSINLVKSEIGQTLTIISLLSIILTIFITICNYNLLRKSSIKYIIYTLFTFGISWYVGISAIYIKSNILIAAILITTGTTITLTIYSLITEYDFTIYTKYYIIGLVAIILNGIINIFLQNFVLQLSINRFGYLLFHIIMINDVQMIVAKKHIKYKFYLNDSVLAVMILFIDTVNLFNYIY